MPVKIGHASIDERNKISGGQAGDQTGKEIHIRSWYAKGWNKLIRPKSVDIAEKIARAMEQACANNNIGYDQFQRTTLFDQAKIKNWDISKVDQRCETDCSALVAVCVNAAGISVSKDIYTGNEAKVLSNTGQFDILTDGKYLTTDKYLRRGDILLKEGSHTAIVLSNGSNANINPIDLYEVTASYLNMRTGPGKTYNIIGVLPKNTIVQCRGCYTDDDGKRWFYIEGADKIGYASSKYLRKV